MRNNCNRFLAALDLSAAETTQAWYQIATRLLERVVWKLGWWIGRLDGLAKGRLWRIFIDIDDADPGDNEHDHHFFRVVATLVEVVENNEYTLLLEPGGPLRTSSIVHGISTLRLLGGNPWASPYVHGFPPLSRRLVHPEFPYGDLSFNSNDTLEDDSSTYTAQKLPAHLPYLPVRTESWKLIAGRQWDAPFSDAPYPPPLLSQLLDQRKERTAREGPGVPSIALSRTIGAGTRTETLLSILRPSSLPKVANELVQTGIYVAPYSAHGWEYLLVRVRELTEDDFQDTWPWEGSMAVAPSDIQDTDEPNWENPHNHLGPFSTIQPTDPLASDPMRVSRDHVRRGCKVLEGIKIMGDKNVPGGQRSFIAFLDDPLVRLDDLQEAEETFPEVFPERDDELPWPFVSQPPATTEVIVEETYTQTYFSPERGIDLPGVIRLANFDYSFPQWTGCVVHVECKTRFTVATFGANGKVFRKLKDWGV
ncbi:hypothetical protein FRC01_007002 [Tulasnella sp. 417]|nr:hypothetical protein FRC01_007002 [Tulasnella sp. 417]